MVNVLDVQRCANQAVGAETCGTCDLKGTGVCDVIDSLDVNAK